MQRASQFQVPQAWEVAVGRDTQRQFLSTSKTVGNQRQISKKQSWSNDEDAGSTSGADRRHRAQENFVPLQTRGNALRLECCPEYLERSADTSEHNLGTLAQQTTVARTRYDSKKCKSCKQRVPEFDDHETEGDCRLCVNGSYPCQTGEAEHQMFSEFIGKAAHFSFRPIDQKGVPKFPQNSNGFYGPSEEREEENYAEFCCPKAKHPSAELAEQTFYCYACKLTFCDACWNKAISHKRNRPGHEKIDVAVAKLIEDTLENHSDETEQAHLHLLDECASWFGAIHEDDGAVFLDFGRYPSLMAELPLTKRKRAYPALVSFVGDTGAGKSSLIKLLIGTKTSKTTQGEEPARQTQQTPVVGSNGATTPTSGDVHLYADPETFHSERPILYADCEGLRGGTLEPVGARWRRKMRNETRNRSRTVSFDRHVRRMHQTAEREILWATTPEKLARKYLVEHLYPRLLYTFSDVIVFVVKNARGVEDVVEQLVVWADAVIQSSSNQPVIPHAIIVLNASDNQDSQLWNVDNSTKDLLNELGQAVNQNPRLKGFAEKWGARGFDTSSVKSLLLAYYSSVRVLRIPEKTAPSLIHDQIKQLYDEISNCVMQSHEEKHKRRLKLDGESLQPYLQQAFDHFCDNLDDPFDFIKTSFANTGIPPDFCGNTLKLAAEITQNFSEQINGPLLFKELSFLVASCVMLDSVRNFNLGEAGAIFKEYIHHFDETLDDYCDKVWPCEYVQAEERCTNVRVGHAKGHQLGRGQVIAGEYQSSFSAEAHRQTYRHFIFGNLQQLLSRLTKLRREMPESEQEIAAQLHQDTILQPFYLHVGGAHRYVSHSTCLSCLVSPAEHCLPCGHVLCTPCVKDFGKRKGPLAVEMEFCPLHKATPSSWLKVVPLKPEHAGSRVLSLDGGGVRGILILMTLQQLQSDLGDIPIQNFFDFMIGTSTGGIIALGLAQMGWSVSECLGKFKEFATQAFQKHKWSKVQFLDPLVTGMAGGRYKIEPLEEILASQYKDQNLFGGVGNGTETNMMPCKVAVTTTSTSGTPFLLANYNRIEKGEPPLYTFLRAEKPAQEIRIWQAARATSAATRKFKPFRHIPSGHTFIDGGIYYNNPLEIALSENKLLWSQDSARLPDVLLSLGTGWSEKKKRRTLPPLSPSSRNPIGNMKQWTKIAIDHVKASLESEKEYTKIRGHYSNSQEANKCFKRFNYVFESDFGKLAMDDVDMIPKYCKFAEDDLVKRKREIRDITNRLIACSFFLDVEQGSPQTHVDGSMTLKGHIRCRFPQYSLELRQFGDLLADRIQEAKESSCSQRHSPCFVVEDKSRPADAVQILLDDYKVDGMQRHGRFSLDKITITTMNYKSETDIYLRFGNESGCAENNSISGFPRRWDDRRLSPMPSRLRLSEMRACQASRRGRPMWREPSSVPENVLEIYAQGRNPGMATDHEMVEVNSRLCNSTTWKSAFELDSNDSLRDRPVLPLKRFLSLQPLACPPSPDVPAYRTKDKDAGRCELPTELASHQRHEMPGSQPNTDVIRYEPSFQTEQDAYKPESKAEDPHEMVSSDISLTSGESSADLPTPEEEQSLAMSESHLDPVEHQPVDIEHYLSGNGMSTHETWMTEQSELD